jgi:hypothetical protein
VNIEVNWEEVDEKIVAITVGKHYSLLGWTSVPRWDADAGGWTPSDGKGGMTVLSYPKWVDIYPIAGVCIRPAPVRFVQSNTGQMIIDTLSATDFCIRGLDNIDRKQLLDLLNRVDREGR